MEFLTTKRGKPSLLLDGYRYTKKREHKSGVVKWCCVARPCGGKVFIRNNEIIKQENHLCVPDVASIEVQKVISQAKKRAREETDKSILEIYKEEFTDIQQMGYELATKIPQYSNFKTTLYNQRRGAHGVQTEPSNRDAENLNEEVSVSPDGKSFLMTDDCEGDSMLVFASSKQKEIMNNSKNIFSDGTFKSVHSMGNDEEEEEDDDDNDDGDEGMTIEFEDIKVPMPPLHHLVENDEGTRYSNESVRDKNISTPSESHFNKGKLDQSSNIACCSREDERISTLSRGNVRSPITSLHLEVDEEEDGARIPNEKSKDESHITRSDNFRSKENTFSRNCQRNSTVKSKESDEYSTFGELVGHKVRKLRTEELRNAAEYQIMKVLYELALSDENDPSYVPPLFTSNASPCSDQIATFESTSSTSNMVSNLVNTFQ